MIWLYTQTHKFIKITQSRSQVFFIRFVNWIIFDYMIFFFFASLFLSLYSFNDFFIFIFFVAVMEKWESLWKWKVWGMKMKKKKIYIEEFFFFWGWVVVVEWNKKWEFGNGYVDKKKQKKKKVIWFSSKGQSNLDEENGIGIDSLCSGWLNCLWAMGREWWCRFFVSTVSTTRFVNGIEEKWKFI